MPDPLTTPFPLDVTTGVLLAGGSGRRAGVDKRYLVLDRQTLLQRNLGFLSAVFPAVAISLRHGQTADTGDLGPVEMLYDEWPGSSPLAGIATALTAYRRPVFVMAADLAFPDPFAVARLLAAYPGHDVAIPVVGSNHEPLFAVYGPACLGPMTALLEQGRHRILEILPDLSVAAVPFSDARPFHNVNTREAYEAARDISRDGKGFGGLQTTGRDDAGPALLAIVGKSDAGKTTLIERLVPELVKLGLHIGTVKHDVHGFEIDYPGKDSWRHGQSGADAYAIASPNRLAFIARLEAEMPLDTIATTYFTGFDLVLAEGYKRSAPHRIEVFRLGAGHEVPLCESDESLALVTDAPLEHVTRFALDDVTALARFIASRLETLRRY